LTAPPFRLEKLSKALEALRKFSLPLYTSNDVPKQKSINIGILTID